MLKNLLTFTVFLLAIAAHAQTNPFKNTLWRVDSTDAQNNFYMRKEKWDPEKLPKDFAFVKFAEAEVFSGLSCFKQYGIYRLAGDDQVLIVPAYTDGNAKCTPTETPSELYTYDLKGERMVLSQVGGDASGKDPENHTNKVLRARSPLTDARYKSNAGLYGSGMGGLTLFEDGRYILTGYATFLPGNYYYMNDELWLFPDVRSHFVLYATYNPQLVDSVRVVFGQFSEGKTYLQFNNEPAQRVFNDDANCFSGPFVYQTKKSLASLTFYDVAHKHEDLSTSFAYTYSFKNKENDFMVMYVSPAAIKSILLAHINAKEKKILFYTPLFGSSDGLDKATESEENMQELLNMKKAYEKAAEEKYVYANRHSRQLEEELHSGYRFDDKNNRYVFKDNLNNNYYKQNPYNDMRIIRKYVLQRPIRKSVREPKAINNKGTVFYTSCHGVKKSYEYTEIKTEKDKETSSEPATIEVPPPPMQGNGQRLKKN